MEEGRCRCGWREGSSSWPRAGVAPWSQEDWGESRDQFEGVRKACEGGWRGAWVDGWAPVVGEKKGRRR